MTQDSQIRDKKVSIVSVKSFIVSYRDYRSKLDRTFFLTLEGCVHGRRSLYKEIKRDLR